MKLSGAPSPDHTAGALFASKPYFSAVLVLAILIGGGGAEGPLRNGILSALGALLLFWLAADHLTGRHPFPRNSWAPALVALSLFLIPLAQMVPLPPSIWHQLPGRDYVIASLSEIGAVESWRPISVDPEATARATAALLWPIALFLHVLRSSRAQNLLNLKLFVGAACVSGVIGALQLAGGHPDWLAFYDGPTFGSASGTFANPNHQALMMACAIVACGIVLRSAPVGHLHSQLRPNKDQLIFWGLLFFFAVMTLASGSRAGVLLMALGLPAGLFLALGNGSMLRWAAALLSALVIITIVVLLYPATNSLGLRESFRIGADVRYAYLPDILYTLGQYWPAGSGAGTFASVFAPNENLDFAQRGYLNHAHNDFLEWLIDLGLPGAVWLGLAVILLIAGCVRLGRGSSPELGCGIGGLLILMLAAVHSLADYPLRSLSVASIAAMAAGLFLVREQEERKTSGSPPLIPFLIALLIAAPIAAESFRLFMVQWSLRENRSSIAAAIGPSNGDVLVGQAEQALKGGQPGNAKQLAARAVLARPMNAAALRALASAKEASAEPAASTWRVASSLGWRDPSTQVWAFRQALIDGELETAAARADALIRTSSPPIEFMRLVREASSQERFAQALAGRITANAPWRRGFFTLSGKPSERELFGVQAVIRHLSFRNGVDRADVRSLISHLIKRKSFDRAVQVDRMVAGERRDGANLVDDGGFDRQAEDYASGSTAFDWNLRKGEHVTGYVDATPPSHLSVDSDGEGAGIAAERYLVLPTGAYNFSYRVRSEVADMFRVRLFCVSEAAPLAVDIAPISRSFTVRTIEFSIETRGCSMARLLVEATMSGRAATAEYDDFSITRR